MYTQEQIFEKISDLMVELFELDKADIKMDSHLYEDLELDSIDAIDLIGELQSFVGQRLQPEDFKAVRTVEGVVKAAEDVLRGQTETSV
ncbi:MAG: acyl carrier protein [Bdellovibrionota bacterium]|nr:acyl carrier protein [Bdellovibrionota bacterium]